MTGYTDNFDHAKPFSDTCAQFALATNVAQPYTVPGPATQKYRVKFTFNATANVFVGYGVTAVAPTAGTMTTAPNIEFRPDESKFAFGGNTLSFVTPDASAYVGVSLLSIPG